uniref:Uncharacterized protein n=1 Tax=Anguilla anguilla TaxID=7936 RepID=A0A0E9R0G2_ANGAN
MTGVGTAACRSRCESEIMQSV